MEDNRNIQILKYNNDASDGNLIFSKEMNMDGKDVFFLIKTKHRSIVKTVENALIDILSDNPQVSGDTYEWFSDILKESNISIQTILKQQNLSDFHVFYGVMEDGILHFSTLGNQVHGLLLQGKKIIDITPYDDENSSGEFSYISSGTVGKHDTLYVSNLFMYKAIPHEDLEILKSSNVYDLEILEELYKKQEVDIPVQTIIINNEQHESQSKFIQKILLTSQKYLTKLQKTDFYNKIYTYIKNHPKLSSKNGQITLFVGGVFVLIALLYFVIAGILGQGSKSYELEADKEQLIQADLCLQQAIQFTTDPDLFKEKIACAENIIFQMRNKQSYIGETKRIYDTITNLKKQVNGVETFTLEETETLYTIPELKDFDLIKIIQIQEKYYLIGKTGIVGPYTGGSAKVTKYPDGKTALFADESAIGGVYIYTSDNQILEFYKDKFSYVTQATKPTWPALKEIITYAGNIYGLTNIGDQILKFTPNGRNFLAPKNFIEDEIAGMGVVNFAIDGGIYILKKSLEGDIEKNMSVDKIITAGGYIRNSLYLNNLPENYTLPEKDSEVNIIAGINLDNVYMLLGNNIFIFMPDTKSYKEVQALNYIGQIEVLDTPLSHVFIPEDGKIIFNEGEKIREINFTITAEGKILK